MKLHGKATLILRDAKTGRIKHKESHSNAITPALSHILTENLAGTLDYSRILPLYSRVLGGVCLFNGNLDSSKVFLPKASEAVLIAHAGQSYDASYTQTDSKVGQPIFGTGQSEPINNGYRFVYTWSQTQGNGTISDLCLTHTDVGSFWNEQKGHNVMASHFCPVEKLSNGIIDPEEYEYFRYDVSFPYISNQKSIPLGFYDDTNTIVAAEQYAADKIRIHLAKFTGKGIWLWNSAGDVTEDQTYDITVGTNDNIGRYIAYDHANKKVYVIQIKSSNGHYFDWNVHFIELDLLSGHTNSFYSNCANLLFNNQEFESHVKNWDGTNLDFSLGLEFYVRGVVEPNLLKQVVVMNGCVYLPIFWIHDQFVNGMTNCSVKISLSSPSNPTYIENFYAYNQSSYERDQCQIDLGNGRFMNPMNMVWLNGSGSYEGQDILYDDAGLFIYESSGAVAYCARQSVDSPIQYFTFVRGTPNGSRGCMLNKLYQATAFRLQAPVQKTVSETMQVIYEIKQGEQQGE